MKAIGMFTCVFICIWYSLSFFLIVVDWMEGTEELNDVWKKSNIPYKE